MKHILRNLTLETAHPFGTSRHSAQRYENLLLILRENETIGFGEAAPSLFYGETRGTVKSVLDHISHTVSLNTTPPKALPDVLDRIIGENPSAKAALEIALLDLHSKEQGLSLREYLRIEETEPPPTSFTIGLDNLDRMAQKVKDASDFPILKIKVGTDRDHEVLAMVRDLYSGTLRIDANGAWHREEAVEHLKALAKFEIELVEQPTTPLDPLGLGYVKQRVDIPVFADESIRRASDLPLITSAIDGVNVKLMKCGGMRRALDLIRAARKHNLQLMIGCMIESSLGITAAAHLTPLVDFVDLDGHLLLRDDPFSGVKVDRGELTLPQRAGLGVEPKDPRLCESEADGEQSSHPQSHI